VDYEAVPSDSLVAARAQPEDPVKSRIVYTDSEPDRGLEWRVAKEDPSDRALWSIDVEVAADEDVIANGKRLSDTPKGDGHIVAYALDKPIPTYMMAFAAGQIVHTDRTTGRVPLSLWYRRGLAIHPDDNLDAVADAMATFDKLMGDYPWDSYATVLVPQFAEGGMENATITFNQETSGQGNVAFGLNAHELGHHWFGDWVTMHAYDDVWIKEGMATLLASEATRARRDREGKGRLFGHDFSFDPADAVVDPTLHGLDKYTSGPYERAAWTLTQIRAKIGEDAFWGSLRQVLADHALGSIDSESFVRAFAPALDDASIAQVLASLEVFDVPSFDAQIAPNATDATASDVTFTVDDPAHVLLVPLDVTVVDAAGVATTSTIVTGTPLTVTVPPGGYLALDEKEVHPYLGQSWNDPNGTFYTLAPLFLPPPGPALDALETRSAAAQEVALGYADAAITPAQLGAYVAALDSDTAKRYATYDACNAIEAATTPEDIAAWSAALTPIVRAPAQPFFDLSYASCGVSVGTSALGAELDMLATQDDAGVLARLEYLIGFDYGPQHSFAVLSTLATHSPSGRLRDLAYTRLSYQATGYYSPVLDADRTTWQALFRERLALVTTSGRFLTAWRAEVALFDAQALPIAAAQLHTIRLGDSSQRQVVCDASNFDAADFDAFRDALQPWSELSTAAQEVLADPTKCNP
jgi:hypothetical protein